ncbi:MAG: dihydroorotate dehydrogenase electron transfer subunit [Gammaproteobacteria bacterium]|jgi:dihydroorotate dehydrogenase electron transfer subunit
MSQQHRNTIFVEEAEILSHESLDGGQQVLRVAAPKLAAHAVPGSFVHIQCDPQLAMRRPMSVMRVDAQAGWAEFLYKTVGKGTRLLAQKRVGDTISVLGPVGRGFEPDPARPRALLIGGGVGIPPMVFLAERLRRVRTYQPFVLMGSEVPFPFPLRPSQIMLPGMPDGTIACMPLMEDWGIASRLASLQGYAGCHDGYVTDLARAWLDALDDASRQQVAIYSCGPTPMLKAVADLASAYELPCQVCLEEFMACAVGGCAGCAVRVRDGDGQAMKRVCVDGPVFAADSVLWEALPH